MVAVLLGLAVIAHAAISSIQPSSGQGEPGETVSAVVSVTTSGVTSCLTATSDVTLVITFDGMSTTCGSGTWSAIMEVTIPAVTPAGSYTVTVREASLLGGSLLGSHTWLLQVTAPPTTTSTLLPEVTLFPSTTAATTSTTTTTTTPSTTTTSTGSNSTTTTASSRPTLGADEFTTTTQEEGVAYSPPAPAPPLAEGTTTSIAASAAETTGGTRIANPDAAFSEIAVSSGLIEVADRELPPVFAQALLSPLVILEVLLRALGRTGNGLLIPLGLTILAGFGLARRLRHDVEELPELDEFIEIPAEGEDRP